MKLTLSQLKKAGELGAKNTSKSFSQLAKQETKVVTSEIKKISVLEASRALQKAKDIIVIYSSVSETDSKGYSFMTIQREDAIRLVDLIQGRPKGTTKVMKEMDRSLLKELANILSNSYLNALCAQLDLKITLSAPNLAPTTYLQKLIEPLLTGKGEALSFTTVLDITKEKIKTEIIMILHFGQIEIIN